MWPAVARIDSILVEKGQKTLADMEAKSRHPGQANEALL